MFYAESGESMRSYLKQSGLYIVYHPPVHLVGSVMGGIFSIIIGAFLEHHREIATDIVQPLLVTFLPIVILFYIFYHEAYEKRRFEPLSIVLCAIPFFVIQHITLCIYPYGATLINGGYFTIAELIFEKIDYLWQHLVVQLGLQLLIYLPTYLLASYCGYRHRKNEIEKMTEKPEETK